jgi:membrane-associated protease RseP (regulator of RpoE activity)
MKKEHSPFTDFGEPFDSLRAVSPVEPLSRAVYSSRTPAGRKLWVLLLLVPLVAAATGGRETITAGALLEQVRILASPAMAGRGVGTPGIEKAADHIAREFQRTGLKPGGTHGYRQTFEVITGVRVGPETRMRVIPEEPDPGKSEALAETLFTPFGFSEDGAVEGEVVFAGYGITAPELNYDDYAGISVTDKIVLVMTHEPREKDETSPFRHPDAFRYTEVRYKAINAREHGARAIIVVEDPLGHADQREELFGIRGVAGGNRAGIIAVNAKRSVVERLLKRTGKTLAQFQQAIDKTPTPQSFVIPGSRVAIQVKLIEERGTAANIIGILPGRDPVLRETAVVVGAHYDHLGLGGEYSLAPSQYGEIHPGADDNASGTAALILLARAFAKSGGAERTLIFAAFSAEEMGIVGSSHYTKRPRIPLEQTVAMINLDMVGRLKDQTLYVFGVKTGKEFADLLQEVNRDRHLILKLGGGAYGPSDHTSFYARKIPALLFFTGPHGDYHRPSDTVDKINASGLAEVTRFVYRVVEHLANRTAPVTYVRVEEPPGGGPGGGYGAYFGSIPDFASQDEGGVRLIGVRAGSPAEKAGLREGDVIVQLGGVHIKNLHDLVYALRSKRAGDQVEVVFVRSGQEHCATTTLEQRR